MDSNLDKIALDLYGKVQTRFPNIKIGDENSVVLSKEEDIPKARFFEFEYEEDGEPLGTIAITLDIKKGIVVQVSGDLVNDDDDTTHHGAYKFIRSFRQFAKDRLLKFDVQNIGKSNLDKRDYKFQAKRKEEPTMPDLMENKMYGNNKMSYQDLGEARLVVKHNQPVNLDLAAGRTMHIESIYIENAVGERFKYPFKHLNGARALAEHIKAGGNPYDAIGKHICNLSEELASLRKFKGYVNRQEQISEAMGSVTSKVMERIDSIKKEIHNLQRPTYYQAFAESFQAQEEKTIPEAVMNDWIDRLTIRTFNEELTSVFPYLYNIIGEDGVPVKELTPDDLLGEGPSDTAQHIPKDYQTKEPLKQGPDGKWRNSKGEERDGMHGGPLKPGGGAMHRGLNLGKPAKESVEDQFENFIEDIVSEDQDELFSPNKDAQRTAIEKLNKIMGKELKGGPEGINAIQSLKGLIDDPEFLNTLRDIDPDLDVRPLVQQFVQSQAPDVAVQLHFGGEEGSSGEAEAPPAPAAPVAPEQPPAAPTAPAAPEQPPAAPAAPVAEGNNEDPPFDPDPKPSKKTTPGKHGQEYSQARHLAHKGLQQAIAKAKKAGATLDTKMDFGHKTMTLHDAIKECGLTPMECGFNDSPKQQGGGVGEILKTIAGFWNAKERNFTIGGTRAKTKVIKDFKDGAFPSATSDDVKQVLSMIEKMDPTSNDRNQIVRLAGLRPGMDEAGEQGIGQQANMEKLSGLMQKLKDLQSQAGAGQDDGQDDGFGFGNNFGNVNAMFDKIKNMPGAKVTNTSSGTIDGKSASYDDAMAKAKGMGLPDMGGMMKGMSGGMPDMGGMMKGMTGGMPGKMPQGAPNMGQMNPTDMMKDIMGKINFGK